MAKLTRNLAYSTMPICPVNLPRYGFVKEEDGSHTEISGANIQHIIYEICLLLNTSNPFIDLHYCELSYLPGFMSTSSWLMDNDHIFMELFQLADTIDNGLWS